MFIAVVSTWNCITIVVLRYRVDYSVWQGLVLWIAHLVQREVS